MCVCLCVCVCVSACLVMVEEERPPCYGCSLWTVKRWCVSFSVSNMDLFVAMLHHGMESPLVTCYWLLDFELILCVLECRCIYFVRINQMWFVCSTCITFLLQYLENVCDERYFFFISEFYEYHIYFNIIEIMRMRKQGRWHSSGEKMLEINIAHEEKNIAF